MPPDYEIMGDSWNFYVLVNLNRVSEEGVDPVFLAAQREELMAGLAKFLDRKFETMRQGPPPVASKMPAVGSRVLDLS